MRPKDVQRLLKMAGRSYPEPVTVSLPSNL
jgi:hypothetical protein